MQMPGGHQGNSLSGYGTIGLRTSAERQSRKASKTPLSLRQAGVESTKHDNFHHSENHAVLAVEVARPSSADGLESGRLPTNKNTDVVDVRSSTKHSRSRIWEKLTAPFTRRRNHSAAPATRTPLPEQLKNPLPPSTRKLSNSISDGLDILKIGGETLMKPVLPLVSKTWDNFKFENDRTPGVMGLENHGNTCYMNAIVQCLSNTEHFAEYFLTDRFQRDILAAQSAGRTCSVTQQFARLITSLWTCEYRSNISIAFKSRVGEQASQYSGDEQNDAQEFLQWLLDHINEELYGSSNSIINGQMKKVCLNVALMLIVIIYVIIIN